MRLEGAEAGNRVQTAVGTIEKALWGMTSVNQLSYIPYHRKYIGLGAWGQTPVCSKWCGIVIRFHVLLQSS